MGRSVHIRVFIEMKRDDRRGDKGDRRDKRESRSGDVRREGKNERDEQEGGRNRDDKDGSRSGRGGRGNREGRDGHRSSQSDTPAAPAVRPTLKLAARTVPITTTIPNPPSSAIFGGAKPRPPSPIKSTGEVDGAAASSVPATASTTPVVPVTHEAPAAPADEGFSSGGKRKEKKAEKGPSMNVFNKAVKEASSNKSHESKEKDSNVNKGGFSSRNRGKTDGSSAAKPAAKPKPVEPVEAASKPVVAAKPRSANAFDALDNDDDEE